MKASTLCISLFAFAAFATVRAQLPTSSAGETALTLDVGNGIRFVPPSHVTVPAGEKLKITGPGFGGRPVQWLKNNQAIPGATSNPLVLENVRPSDAGTYVLVNNEPNVSSIPSQTLILGVGPSDRLLNLSARGWVGGPDQAFIAGFVIANTTATSSKKILLRAIGPSLAQFFVANPLSQPVLKIYDSAGNLYTAQYAYTAVVGGSTPESDLTDALTRTGAFSVPAGTKDVAELRPFPAGN